MSSATQTNNPADTRRALAVLDALVVLEDRARKGAGKEVYKELCSALGYQVEVRHPWFSVQKEAYLLRTLSSQNGRCATFS